MSLNKKGKVYYYTFMLDKRVYRGTCKNCKSVEDAKAFENQMKDFVRRMRTITNEQALLLQYRKEITGSKEIPLPELVEIAINKPQSRPRKENENNLYRIRWRDFVLFMSEHFPEVKTAGDVLTSHAEKYLEHLTKKGSYRSSRIGNTFRLSHYKLTSTTVGQYISVMDFVFKKTMPETGIPYSPFSRDRIVRVSKKPAIDREAFTMEELNTIAGKMFEYPRHKNREIENGEYPPRLGQLFIVAFHTGMRLGDCCCLKWDNLDFSTRSISVKTRKTGNAVLIPMLPDLYNFLLEEKRRMEESPQRKKPVYVFPFWEEAYRKNASCICQQIRTYFEAIGLETRRKNSNGRNQPVKSFHSFRHTFASLAITNGIPLNVVQSIIGHSTQKMTEHYSRHIAAGTMREKMAAMPQLLQCVPDQKEEAKGEIIEKITRQLENLPLEELKNIYCCIAKKIK